MTSIFKLHQGSVPLLISMPHNGSNIPADIASDMTEAGLSSRDTDWYKDKLYEFAKQKGAYLIQPEYSRYVVDLNRSPEGGNLYPGANSTELCPTTAFDLAPLYKEGRQPNEQEIEARVAKYMHPYHQSIKNTLAKLVEQYGIAILLEAHSIKSEVPRFFDGVLPDFNFGTADGKSCNPKLLENVLQLNWTPYSVVSNARFKGGYITRHFGQPQTGVHAIQLELSQRTYMNEQNLAYDPDKAALVIPKLAMFVDSLIAFAAERG